MDFQLYGTAHLNYIYAMALSWVIVPFIAKKCLDKVGHRNLAIALAIFILGIEIIDDFYRFLDPKMGWSISRDLPLHMCGLSVIGTSWVLIKKNQLVFELCYFWGLGGALQAILTPDSTNILDHFYLFSFMASHGLIILNISFLIFVEGMVLRKWALLRAIIITEFILVIVYIINLILGSNYFYLINKPDAPNPFLIGEWPVYLFYLQLAAIVILGIINLPMVIYRRRLER